MNAHALRWTVVAVLAACGSSQPQQQHPATGDPASDAPDRKALLQPECETRGGSVVGDIGDGATHRPDYVCPSGKPPLGNIAPPPGGPIGVEGSVCCPR